MGNWGGKREPGIEIDGEYIRGLIRKNGMDLTSVSRSILCKSECYLSNACRTGRISEDALLRILDHFNGDLDSALGIAGKTYKTDGLEALAKNYKVDPEGEMDIIDSVPMTFSEQEALVEIAEEKEEKMEKDKKREKLEGKIKKMKEVLAEYWVAGEKTVKLTQVMDFIDVIEGLL